MLKFEFVQPGEFDNPFYLVSNEGIDVAEIHFQNGEWGLDYLYKGLNSVELIHIASRINKLNKSTQQQLILGVF